MGLYVFSGNTPLHYACATQVKQSQEIIEFLIDHGADYIIENKKGKKPLDLAPIQIQQHIKFEISKKKSVNDSNQRVLEIKIMELESKLRKVNKKVKDLTKELARYKSYEANNIVVVKKLLRDS